MVSVSQLPLPNGASSPYATMKCVFSQVLMPPRETIKWVFPKCRCPEGPRRQGKLWSECFPSVDAPRGLVAKGNYVVNVYWVIDVWGALSLREKKESL
mgnify:CR=1 FL=1